MSRLRFILAAVVLAGLTGCIDNDRVLMRESMAVWNDFTDCIMAIKGNSDVEIYNTFRQPRLSERQNEVDKRWQTWNGNAEKKDAEEYMKFKVIFKDCMDSDTEPTLETFAETKDPPLYLRFTKAALSAKRCLRKEIERIRNLPNELAKKKIDALRAAGDPNPQVDINVEHMLLISFAKSIEDADKKFTLP